MIKFVKFIGKINSHYSEYLLKSAFLTTHQTISQTRHQQVDDRLICWHERLTGQAGREIVFWPGFWLTVDMSLRDANKKEEATLNLKWKVGDTTITKNTEIL